MRSAGSSTWDQTADRVLFLAIIAEGQLTSMKWGPISTKMQSKGYSFSAEACRQHFQKLRKEAGGSGTPSSSARATPNKKATPAKGKKRKVVDEDPDNEDDEEEFGGGDDPSPSKKSKKGEPKKEEVDEDEGFASQTAASFKTEDLDEGGKVKHHQIIDLETDDLYDDDDEDA